MKTFTTGIAFLFLLSGCARPYYQLYTTSSKDLKTENNLLVNADDNLRITYNFWGNAGNGDFFIFNKTQKEIYVDLGRSHIVIDSIAYSYYPTIQYGRNPEITDNDLAVNINLGNPLITTTLSHQFSRIIILPPESGKYINGYHLKTLLFKHCDKELFPKLNETITFTFDKETSPFLARNIICYSFTENFNEFNLIDDEFWVTEVSNYPGLKFMKTVRIVECEENTKVHKEVFRYESPSKFYLKYNDLGIGF